MRRPWDYEEPACAEVGVTLFFQPDRDDPQEGSIRDIGYRYGKSVCKTCPHKMECAEWGIENEIHGLWGGLTPNERKTLRSKGNRVPLKMPVVARYN